MKQKQKFFELSWSWYEDHSYWTYYHPNKTEEGFKKDVALLLKKYGDDYIKSVGEGSWVQASGWINFISPKMNELGYEDIIPFCFGHFGSYIIKGKNDEDKEFEKLVGKKLFQKSVKINRCVERKMNALLKKTTNNGS